MRFGFLVSLGLVFSVASIGVAADSSLCSQWKPVFSCSPVQAFDYDIHVVADPASEKFGVCLYQAASTVPVEVYQADGQVTLDGVSWLQLLGGPAGIAGHLVTQEEGNDWIGNLQYSGQAIKHRFQCQH